MFGNVHLIKLFAILGVGYVNAVPSLYHLETRATNSSSNNNNSTITTTSGPYGLNNANCTNLTLSIPINITLSNFTNVDNYYANQSYITKTIIELTEANSNWTMAHMSSNTSFNLNTSYDIAGYYCTPKQGGRNESAVWNLVHGIGFDSSYWDYGLSSEYSLVKHAASYGISTFRYDRLGTGNSETPANGFDVVQAQTEVAILEQILTRLRTTTEIGGKRHEKVVGVGHSYGSIQTQAISKQSPELLDGVVLTGFTTNSTNMPGYLQAASYSIAKEIFPERFSEKPSTWLVTGSNASDIMGFFYPDFYSQASFDLSRNTEQPVTLGALATVGAVSGEASNFTGPVHVVNGAKDFIFCSSNCYANGTNGRPIPEAVQMLYPMASNFTSYISENTGHAITPHYSAPEVAEEMVKWVLDQGL
ncbi:uncharacterized protein MEPE_02919 [Melanopsichium pennsylvanicum]|uniref:AB hydrolase-1 domain-containing protein n=2 Tax=Melanopsichium pennsylvanicum TaxID=63383 RepID=A0AAJ5C4Z4_9BASI|nr:conserved hypothetical protein [Melanopsichium pennsylvanicum 4]SNX84211.1 uncharacterized protein MEPE_02919 [Melanopsichium pennsylvanicum]